MARNIMIQSYASGVEMQDEFDLTARQCQNMFDDLVPEVEAADRRSREALEAFTASRVP